MYLRFAMEDVLTVKLLCMAFRPLFLKTWLSVEGLVCIILGSIRHWLII
jgi:hypothetical protein